MFDSPLTDRKPGLFVTGTDTGVGKTIVTCAIASVLAGKGLKVGVFKPFATGSRRDRLGQLVHDDALALQQCSGCSLPLKVINPIRYEPPLAPAVAAHELGQSPDMEFVAQCLEQIDQASDVVLIEGVGGLLVPLADRYTVLDLIAALRFPVLVVTRAGLGTLNHTAMTVRLLQQGGGQVAGLVINQDSRLTDEMSPDASLVSNPWWLRYMNAVPILATVPHCSTDRVIPQRGELPNTIIDAVVGTDWLAYAG